MHDLLIEILSTVRKNKLRTALTGFSVSWGIFMLIVLLGAGNGLLNATKSNSMDIMANSMMVGGGRTSMPYNGLKKGRFVQLRQSDIDITGGKEFADNIEDVTGLVEYSVNISNLKESVSCSLRGVYPAYGKIEKIKISHGRFINDIDLAERRKVVVLGSKIADELLNDSSIPTENIVGQYVNIEKINYKVVGIYASDQMRRDAAYMPFSSMLTLYGLGDKVHNIIFSFNNLNTAEANKQFEKKYRAVINTNHRAAPADPNKYYDLDYRNFYSFKRNRGCFEYYVDKCKRENSRVWHQKGIRCKTFSYSGFNSSREYYDYGFFRICRYGLRNGSV